MKRKAQPTRSLWFSIAGLENFTKTRQRNSVDTSFRIQIYCDISLLKPEHQGRSFSLHLCINCMSIRCAISIIRFISTEHQMSVFNHHVYINWTSDGYFQSSQLCINWASAVHFQYACVWSTEPQMRSFNHHICWSASVNSLIIGQNLWLNLRLSHCNTSFNFLHFQKRPPAHYIHVFKCPHSIY